MIRTIFLLFLALALSAVGFYSYQNQQELQRVLNNNISVLLVYSNGGKESIGIRTFSSVLEEEGVAYEVIDNEKLLSVNPQNLSHIKPAIIFPDHASDYLSFDTKRWIKTYLKSGGDVCIVGDAGSKDIKGRYLLKEGIFDTFIGLKQVKDKAQTFVQGPLQFKNPEVADYFGIPEGKYDKEGHIVGYQYGILTYGYKNVSLKESDTMDIYAWSDRQTKVPLIVRRDIGKGALLFVNLFLGELKGKSDDLLLRSVLRTYLFKMVKVPHLVSSPHAKGGLIINFHIDSNAEHVTLPWFIDQKYMNEKLKYSIHITAGPDCYEPGDSSGFFAEEEGKKIIEQMMPFGEIGSHGGWAHDWFSNGIEKGSLDEGMMKHYIDMNNKALEDIITYKIKEYSAPGGMFPQPVSVKILAELGMESYYYTGDSGSAPNRTFYEGEKLSDTIIAFPVMTFGKKASIHEFQKEHVSERKVEEVLKKLIDYVVKNRTVRLYYTHPYDIYRGTYHKAFKAFIEYAVANKEQDLLSVESMSYFRDYLLRFLDTKKVFKWQNGNMQLEFSSKKGLDAFVIAVPKLYAGKKIKSLKELEEDAYYYYLPIDTNSTYFSKELLYE